MKLTFIDEDLDRMFRDPAYRSKKWHPDLVRAFRKAANLVKASPDRKTLAAFRGLRLEKLKGDREGQYSMRVTEQWRLIARFEAAENEEQAVIIEMVDYH